MMHKQIYFIDIVIIIVPVLLFYIVIIIINIWNHSRSVDHLFCLVQECPLMNNDRPDDADRV